jgi:ABC-type polysaccharide/polyol phosphate export permease
MLKNGDEICFSSGNESMRYKEYLLIIPIFLFIKMIRNILSSILNTKHFHKNISLCFHNLMFCARSMLTFHFKMRKLHIDELISYKYDILLHDFLVYNPTLASLH